MRGGKEEGGGEAGEGKEGRRPSSSLQWRVSTDARSRQRGAAASIRTRSAQGTRELMHAVRKTALSSDVVRSGAVCASPSARRSSAA